MAKKDGTFGWDDAERYALDPLNESIPRAHGWEEQDDGQAYALFAIKQLMDAVAGVLPYHLTEDQKDSLDANPALNATERVAGISDVLALGTGLGVTADQKDALSGNTALDALNLVVSTKDLVAYGCVREYDQAFTQDYTLIAGRNGSTMCDKINLGVTVTVGLGSRLAFL